MLDAYRKPISEKRLDVLDGVRALLIFVVAWYHIWQQSWLIPNFLIGDTWISLDFIPRSGYMAVDGMLFLSGLLLYWPLTQEGQTLDVRRFYRKRLARIAPSYVLAILCSLLFTALPEQRYPSALDAIKDLAAHLTFTHNLFYQTYLGSPLNGVLWTLGVEMQFYLLFPLLARFMKKRPLPTLLLMTAVAWLYRFWAAGLQDNSLYINQLPAFLDVYAWGFAAALMIRRLRAGAERHGAVEKGFFTLCLALSAVLLIRLFQAQAETNGIENIHYGQLARRFQLAALWCVFCVSACFSLPFVRFLLGNRVAAFLSAVSYQYYIWHQVLSVKIKAWGIIPSQSESPWYFGESAWQWPYTLLCFLGTLVFAVILTYGFEQPVSRLLLSDQRLATARRKKKTD